MSSRGEGQEWSEGRVRVLGHGRSELKPAEVRSGSGEKIGLGSGERYRSGGIGSETVARQKSHTSNGVETAASVARSGTYNFELIQEDVQQSGSGTRTVSGGAACMI